MRTNYLRYRYKFSWEEGTRRICTGVRWSGDEGQDWCPWASCLPLWFRIIVHDWHRLTPSHSRRLLQLLSPLSSLLFLTWLVVRVSLFCLPASASSHKRNETPYENPTRLRFGLPFTQSSISVDAWGMIGSPKAHTCVWPEVQRGGESSICGEDLDVYRYE